MDDLPSLMLLLLLLCLHLCIGLSWSHSLQQAEHDTFPGTIIQGIADSDAKTPVKHHVESQAHSSSDVFAVDSIHGIGKAPEDKATESQFPSVLEYYVQRGSSNGNNDNYNGENIQGIQHGKPMFGQKMAFLPLEKISTELKPSDLQFREEDVIEDAVQGWHVRTSRTVKDEDAAIERPRQTFYNGKLVQGGEQIGEFRVRLKRKAIHRSFFSKMLGGLSKALHWNIFCSKEGGLLSSLKNLFTGAQNHMKNWFSSSNQRRAPTVWSYTEPLAIVEPVPPVMVNSQCTLKGRMSSILQQVVLDYRSSVTNSHQASCAGKIEEAAVKLREAVSSKLKETLCSKIDSPCEKEFCEFLQSKPKLASLMVLSRFGIDPVAVALSHSIDSGFCASSMEVSHIVDNIHHVMKLGHHIRESLSSRDLNKKESPSRIKFWKSIFTGNQNSCKACFHQVVHNVKKVMKHQLATTCQQARCPKLVSTCSFAKEYKHLVRMLLMLKLQPWRFAARSCTAENSCSLFPNILSHMGTAHKMNNEQLPHSDRVHMIETHSPGHGVPRFSAIRRPVCRKAMLLRRMSLFPLDLRGNPQLPHNSLESLFLEPIQIENHGPEKIFDDVDKVILRLHKFLPDISHEVLESNKHALNIPDSFPGAAHHREAEANLVTSIGPNDFYKLVHDVLKLSAMEDVQLQAAGGNKSSTSEKQKIHHEIQSFAGNHTSSHAKM
ncbi:hypothetical protein O6H91_01G034800 [Diphasiastrum complanatum]|uniref:Uncharacterized protein n=1 Tax=Diphasiastrum complanatum TaxID=34168 RepID=A0ACC2EPU9_DIPCM|nr:hypothetical protein O6H91_01G034800 [Diphasiastrum complanatum]